MSETIIIGILGFLGTVVGSGFGVLASSRLTVYRIEQLEKKVDEHNNIIKRTYELEKKADLFEQELEFLEKKIKEEE